MGTEEDRPPTRCSREECDPRAWRAMLGPIGAESPVGRIGVIVRGPDQTSSRAAGVTGKTQSSS